MDSALVAVESAGAEEFCDSSAEVAVDSVSFVALTVAEVVPASDTAVVAAPDESALELSDALEAPDELVTSGETGLTELEAAVAGSSELSELQPLKAKVALAMTSLRRKFNSVSPFEPSR